MWCIHNISSVSLWAWLLVIKALLLTFIIRWIAAVLTPCAAKIKNLSFILFFFSSTDINDCNPHPWYVACTLFGCIQTFPTPPNPPTLLSLFLLPSSPHFTQTLKAWRGEGPLKAVEVVLKSSLKGASLRRGGFGLLNRAEKSGEKGFWWGVGGGLHSSYATWAGGLGFRRNEGEGRDWTWQLASERWRLVLMSWIEPCDPHHHIHTHKNHVLLLQIEGMSLRYTLI